MAELLVPFVLVPLFDHTLKRLARAKLSASALRLGPFGALRLVRSDVWIARGAVGRNARSLWCVWTVAAAALVVATRMFPSLDLFAGLMLGASFSHLLERTIDGGISDYVCLRFWPAFDLADVALTAGAVGTIVQLAAVIARATA